MKTALTVLCTLLTVLLICGIALNAYIIATFYPKADPLTYPTPESVQAVTLTNADRSAERALSEEDIATLLSYIACTEPTRRQSVNDSPYVTPCYRIALSTEEDTDVYYVYQIRKTTYL